MTPIIETLFNLEKKGVDFVNIFKAKDLKISELEPKFYEILNKFPRQAETTSTESKTSPCRTSIITGAHKKS